MENPLTVKFAELPLTEELQKGIQEAGFESCTPIQAQTLPLALAGKDVAGQGQTGTGKTAAFLLATYNYLLKHPRENAGKKGRSPCAIILAPTRELALQIHSDAQVLGSHTGLKSAVVFGGADYDKQRQTLENGVDILIGTPGRFIDYFKQRVFSLNEVQVVVLDEADRMFDLGFIKDIRYVLRRLPPANERLNLLFSATLGQRVLELAYEHMNEPESIRVEPEKMTVDRVTQIVYFPGNDEKIPLLVGQLRDMDATRTMVFVNTKREAERLEHTLQHNGLSASAISGDVPQKKRMSMLKRFQSGELAILVATDVASRGLHVPDVSHVVNYDLPQDAEDYVHRIGRTARAGATGDAISFACENYAMSLPDIEKYIGHSIPVGQLDPELLADIDIPPPRRRKPPHRHKSGSGNRSGGSQQRRPRRNR
ncbi:MAG: DEAD/DEAH box helicase [Gammaproteobacteria bacterium]